MRSWIKKTLCCLCAVTTVVSALSFSACNQQVINAYDIAVKNGFEGTEEEWLNSLHGKDGQDGENVTVDDLYNAAVAEGFQGTKYEWIQSLQFDLPAQNDTQTIAKNVTSVVSIFCSFNKSNGLSSAGGSGVVLDVNKNSGTAYIVTNYHVIYDGEAANGGFSKNIYLYPYGEIVGFDTTTGKDDTGYGIKATYIGGAMDYDIALLRVTGSEKVRTGALTAATLGDSNDVTVGEKTYAIGNANGLGVSVTSGILSVDSETIVMSALDDAKRNVSCRVMRTDAAVNHGNSGGGLFNLEGELIGITNAKNVEEDTDNVCYALPITMVKYLLQNIAEQITFGQAGYGYRATLGVTTTVLESSMYLDENGKLSVKNTTYIYEIEKGKAADGKLKVGDVLQSVTIGGVTTELTRNFYLIDLLWQVRFGDTIAITVLRDGLNEQKDEVTVGITFNNQAYFTTYA